MTNREGFDNEVDDDSTGSPVSSDGPESWPADAAESDSESESDGLDEKL